MKKKLAVLGVALILVGAVLFVYSSSGNSGSVNSADIHFSWAGIRVVQNGGSVDAHILAVRVPVNWSSITVVNNPDGGRYVFVRRGDLYYPEQPVYFKNIYVENLPPRENVTVYYASGDYAGILRVEADHITVSPGSGGIHLLLDSDGFKVNVTEPRGAIYVGSTPAMVFSNDSFRVGNRTFPGTPVQLLLSYAPCAGKGIGYIVMVSTPGGSNVYNGIIKTPETTTPTKVTFAPGFRFTTLLVLHNYTTYMKAYFGISCPSNSSRGGLSWPLILAISGSVLVLVALFKR
ncbi:hypothetical protein [Thermococcus sp. 21S9]|uniref:hypothetical protein n=1 Tax=Thermococcus sp. 21S9 TaxID=1638223 RepID=UPI00143ACEF5|nr:hypothetical protein [Thermococcus sp. 21S9]NJE53676.1 hypothetical protein [Thermococcus sp. 21S9]